MNIDKQHLRSFDHFQVRNEPEIRKDIICLFPFISKNQDSSSKNGKLSTPTEVCGEMVYIPRLPVVRGNPDGEDGSFCQS